jgi:hypothetical protein
MAVRKGLMIRKERYARMAVITVKVIIWDLPGWVGLIGFGVPV